MPDDTTGDAATGPSTGDRPAAGRPGRARRGPRRRERHGRGLRGPVAPGDVPLVVSRSARFAELVLDAVERLEHRWPQLADVDFEVEEVPPADADAWSADPVPLGRSEAARRDEPARVVVYRRPIEARAEGQDELSLLVHDVVVEEVAELLGLAPETVDPSYGEH